MFKLVINEVSAVLVSTSGQFSTFLRSLLGKFQASDDTPPKSGNVGFHSFVSVAIRSAL